MMITLKPKIDGNKLYNHIFKNRARPFFKPRNTVHADEQDVLHSAGLDLIKNLHPIMFSLGFPNPDAKNEIGRAHV